jgi:hypothetical protein
MALSDFSSIKQKICEIAKGLWRPNRKFSKNNLAEGGKAGRERNARESEAIADVWGPDCDNTILVGTEKIVPLQQ